MLPPTKARTVTIVSDVGTRPAGTTATNCQLTLPVHYGGVATTGNVTNTVPYDAANPTANAWASPIRILPRLGWDLPPEAFSATLKLNAPSTR